MLIHTEQNFISDINIWEVKCDKGFVFLKSGHIYESLAAIEKLAMKHNETCFSTWPLDLALVFTNEFSMFFIMAKLILDVICKLFFGHNT